jgi:hypothetical protein
VEQTRCAARAVLATRLFALGLIGLASAPALAPAATASEPSAVMKAEIDSNYGKLPLSFEANQGQTDSQVKFLARGRGYDLFLTPTEAILSLAKPQAYVETAAPSSPESRAVLAMQFLGADPEPRVTGKDALPGRVNYLRGNDPAHWQTQIPTYAKVACESIYPGVDLVYYGNQGRLEYDFVVAPGADSGVIKLVFRGADRIEISAAGELVLSTASGDIRMHAPVIYQETAGVRTAVAGGYVLKETQEVSFAVAAYDTSRPLVIDPVLVYSTYLGVAEEDVGRGIAVDDRGNAYVTGTGAFNFVFVAKLTPNGRQLLYSTFFGGSDGPNGGSGIAVDDHGNAYVTGFAGSTNFRPSTPPSPLSVGAFPTLSWRSSIGTAASCSIPPISGAVTLTVALESPSMIAATPMSRGSPVRPTSRPSTPCSPISGATATPSWLNSLRTAASCSTPPTSAAITKTSVLESPRMTSATPMSPGSPDRSTSRRSPPCSPILGATATPS